MTVVDTVVEQGLCSGCGICASLSDGVIEMNRSPPGYLRPKSRGVLSQTRESVIADVCPGLKVVQDKASDRHPIWGPVAAVRVGASTDAAIRHHASSGGGLSALLLYLLDTGEVDRVLHTASSDSFPLENAGFVSKTRKDVYHAAGSRYAPSSPLANLDHHLNQPGRFAVVAKPCDIAAVRALSRHDPRVAEKVAILISFFCAGIPSTDGALRILERMQVRETDVTRFRYRGNGWPGRATATLADGREPSLSYVESWGDILSHHVQFRCKICPDGSGGAADVVCADAWHCDEQGYPLLEEEEGRSLVVSRTALGEATVRGAIEAGYLSARPEDPDEIERMQPSQARRKRLVLSRLAAMTLLGRKTPSYQGMQLAKTAVSAGILPNIRSFLGMLRRIMFDAPPA